MQKKSKLTGHKTMRNWKSNSSLGTKDEDLGVYCDLFSAKSSVEGQDGGVVTALLQKGFREGLFDAAIVVRRMQGYTQKHSLHENLKMFWRQRAPTTSKLTYQRSSENSSAKAKNA